jgi:pre-rRNA-processing protein TSR1
MSGHHHRSSGLKQANKRNKRSKASKRSVTRSAGGKVEGRRGQFKQRLLAHNKADRRHIQHQRRDTKRQELLRRKIGLDGGPAPPRIVGIISLGESEVIEEKLRSLIVGQADRVMRPFGSESNSTITVKNDTHKKDGNLTILTNSTAFRSHYSGDNDDAALMAALDLCRVCDMIVFVVDGNEENQEAGFVGMSIGGDDKSHSTNKTNATTSNWDHIISERGDRILAAVKGQGLPRVATILAKTENEEDPGEDHMTTQSAKSIRRGNLKRRTDLKKYVSRFATTEFGADNDKMIEVNLVEKSTEGAMEDDDSVKIDPEEHATKTLAVSLVRTLCSISASPSKWVSNVPRAYVLSDIHIYDPEKQELTLTGYVRGSVPFDSNSAIHVPNLGTFGCKSVSRAKQPYLTGKVEISGDVIDVDPMEREALGMFATPDALDGEQNLIGFDERDEEIDDSGEQSQENENDFARPAGWSDYQSAWLDAVDEDGMNADFDHGELAEELNKKSSGSVAPNTMDLDDANHISEEERKALEEQRRKEQHEHQEFPDEIQVNEGEKARDRFPRYRSLKSFRQSHWDPKENLPDSYAAIYHFSSFKATQQAVMGEMKDVVKAAEVCNGSFWDGEKKTNDPSGDEKNMDDDDADDILKGCVPFGSYITVTLEGVKPKDYSTVAPTALLSAVTLLPHENKVSVLHMGLSHGNNCDVSEDTPVKSKDVLTFRCGWRTWTGRPVFSQNNLNCDKHKFERFLPQTGSFFAASVFGPVTYTPCPVLVFRDLNGKRELVATGSMISADADRIVIKRIILTGYPVRVHKRHATVKYMFYDPEDVKWFKPAGLVTKHGLNGTIQDCVGEHGTMKCLFNAPIKQHDTVCLPLYKRVYPKFETSQAGGDNGGTVRSKRATDSTLVVK